MKRAKKTPKVSYADFIKIRKEYPRISASQAMAWVRSNMARKARPVLDWQDNRQGMLYANIEQSGFTVHVELGYDESPDLSWLGEYSNKPGEDSIDRQASHDQHRGEYRYWNPANTTEEHRQGLRALYYGKHESYTLARSYVLRDYKAHEAYCKGDRVNLYVTATVSYKGVELARESIGGVDVESFRDEYLDDTAWEIIPGAIRQAKDTLADLRKRKGA